MVEHIARHRDRVRQLFDSKAASWPEKYAPDGRLTSRLARLADALFPYVARESDVLDLGCGTGELAEVAAAAGLHVTGCDISFEMLRGAAENDPRSIVDWVLLDPSWRSLPFDDLSFDAVIASSVLEYVADPSAVFDECARVLRPGGIIVCTVPETRHPVRWLEGLILAVGGPLIRVVSRNRPRLAGYVTYLQISRQRHPARWWYAVAAHAGLGPVPRTACSAGLTALRLSVLQRPVDVEDGS